MEMVYLGRYALTFNEQTFCHQMSANLQELAVQ